MTATLRLTDANRSNLQASDSRVTITGPSGWLGSAALAMLDAAFADENLADRVLVFGSHDREIKLPSGRSLACRSIADMRSDDLANALVLHFAYLTKDKTAGVSVEDYVRMNDAIQDRILKGMRRARPRGLFFASSGAVYQPADGGPTRENNIYGWMKARHESEFADAAEASGSTIVNGRIFSVAGEYINKLELYALSDFLNALSLGRPIRLHATRAVWRSYAYVGDIINLALALLIAKQCHRGFDIAGDEPIELGELARRCAILMGIPEARIIRPPISDATSDSMIGDHKICYDFMACYGIEPLSLDQQIRATARYLNGLGSYPRRD